MKSIGIDLAGKEKNPTGVAVLEDQRIDSEVMNENSEIIEKCKLQDPKIIAIDSPLSFPEDNGLRDSDSKLVKRGYRVLPPKLGGMEVLTRRGIQFAEKLSELNFKVIEVHPLTSGRILFETKSKGEWLSLLSEKGWEIKPNTNQHEKDSIIAAFTGYLHLKGETEKVGEDRGIIIPKEVSSFL